MSRRPERTCIFFVTLNFFGLVVHENTSKQGFGESVTYLVLTDILVTCINPCLFKNNYNMLLSCSKIRGRNIMTINHWV